MTKIFTLSLLFVGALFVSSCADYGEKVEQGENEVFYKDGATKEQAQKVLDILIESGAFNPDVESSAQVLKEDDRYIVNIIVREELRESEEVHDFLETIGQQMVYDVFEGDPLTVNITDEKFEVLKEIKIDVE